MIDKLIEKYKEQMNENYDEDNKYADLSKAFAYKEIIKDLEELKQQVLSKCYNDEYMDIVIEIDNLIGDDKK